MSDLVAVGHFTLDLIVSPGMARPKPTLGGPVTFFSLAANKLGAKVAVVSKVGKDLRKHLEWLRRNGVDLSHTQIAEGTSTRFTLTYKNGKRKLQLKSKAPEIFPEDIPDSLYAKGIHVAPVANELPVEAIRKLREKTPLLSIDPQGFIREFDEAGCMKPKTGGDTVFIQYCNVFKSSIQEIRIVAGDARVETAMKKVRRLGAEIVLVTMGRNGALMYVDREFYHVPACKPRIEKDPTGAGDAFIGAFMAEYIKGKEPLWCCCAGSAAASFVIEEVGSQRFGGKDEVYERATKIYEKGIKPLPPDMLRRGIRGWEESRKA